MFISRDSCRRIRGSKKYRVFNIRVIDTFSSSSSSSSSSGGGGGGGGGNSICTIVRSKRT